MSLAIEALRQVCQADGTEVYGVTLRDVDIKTALVIPEKDNGIEIQLRLQELSETWYSFAVESITDDQWTIHCEGRIAANHNPQSSQRKLESRVNLSKLIQRVPGKRWYKAFDRVGFEYGPTFQPLSQIRTNGKDHDAAANVDVSTESGVMDGESRYILHPSTIDACLQLIIISINAGLHKEMSCGVVPLQMEEVNLWFPYEEAGSKGHAVAWTDELNGRYFNTHTKLATESGQLILDVKSMRCVSYEAAVPQNATEVRNREPYMEVSWKPDVATLTSPQVARAYPDVQSDVEAVGKVTELISHKNTINSVILLGESSVEYIDTLKQYLPSTTTFTMAEFSADILDKVQSSVQDDRTSTLLLPKDLSEWSEAITVKHGLVILGESVLQGRSQTSLLDTVKPFIAENGSLVSLVSDNLDGKFSKALSLCGYSDVGFQFNCSNTSVIHSQPLDSNGGAQDTDDKVVIATIDPQRISTQNIVRQLQDRGCNVTSEDLSKVDAAKASKIVIDDMDGTLISELRKDVFDALQKILCSNKPIVWLTSGVNQGKVIFGGMSQGFLRAIRSEQAAAQITLLDVDIDESLGCICEALYQKLENVATKNSGKDTDFWLHQGVTYVSRLVPNTSLNDRLSAGADTTKQSALPAETALSGKIVNAELNFCPSAPTNRGLMNSEVDIQVEASELQPEESQSDSDPPKIIIGKVLRVGSSMDKAAIGQKMAVYTKEVYSTVVRASERLCINAAGFDIAQLAATLPNLCRAVTCLKAGNVEPGEHALVLPTPLPIVGAMSGLSRAFNFKVTLVVETEEEKEECLVRYHVPSGSVLLAKETEAIRRLVSEDSVSAPSAVIASDFSPLSQEIWRHMPAMSRFVLNDGSVDARPDALPFTKGASFIPTGIGALYRQNQASAILKSAVEILKVHPQLMVQQPTVHDISTLEIAKETSDSKKSDEDVVAYNYGQSSIKVCNCFE